LKNYFKFCIIMLLLVAIALSVPQPAFCDQAGANGAIASAQTALKGCYDSVKQAEAEGANVSSLMVTINNGAGLLSQAQLAFAGGDFDSAFSYASQSQSIFNGVVSQANALRDSALQQNSQKFLVTMVPLFISAAVLAAGIGVYVFLGRKERRSFNGAPAV
jgi:hypothetical protein